MVHIFQRFASLSPHPPRTLICIFRTHVGLTARKSRMTHFRRDGFGWYAKKDDGLQLTLRQSPWGSFRQGGAGDKGACNLMQANVTTPLEQTTQNRCSRHDSRIKSFQAQNLYLQWKSVGIRENPCNERFSAGIPTDLSLLWT